MGLPSRKALFDLTGTSVVVTGATGVLCGVMARYLGAEGALVTVLCRDRGRGQAVVDEIREAGGKAIAVEANLLDKGSLEAGLAQTVEAFGKVDGLVNGAGGNHPKATATDENSFFDLDTEAVREVFDVNCLGTILPCQVYGKAMAEQKSGSIINISSLAADLPLTKVVSYSAAKAAVSNFTQWLAVHMATKQSEHIRVNAIAPGFFLTKQNRFLLTDEKTGELTDRGQLIVANTPMGRFGDPPELLGALTWLLSDASKFVTGTVVAVDGGFCAFSGV